MRFVVFLICLILCIGSSVAQVTYTWNGAVSQQWSNPSNWTPSGVPTSIDHIVVGSAPNMPLYDGVSPVTNFTFSSGSIDLGADTLLVTGTATLYNSLVHNGVLRLTGNTVSIGNTSGTMTFNAQVFISSANPVVQNSVFNDSLSFIKTGTGTSGSNGNNVFNAPVFISNTGSGAIYFANTTRDIFNDNVWIAAQGSSSIQLARNDATNPSLFNGNIYVSSTGSATGVYLGSATGSFEQIAGRQFMVSLAGFSSGTLTLNQGVFNSPVSLPVRAFSLSSCVFNDVTYFQKTGTGNINCGGGNVFNDSVSMVISNTGSVYMANISSDVFNGPAHFQNTAAGILYLAHNDASGTRFNGDIYLENTSTGSIRFGQGNGVAFLSDGARIIVTSAGFLSGRLYLRHFVQEGNTAQHISTNGTSIVYVQAGSEFNAPFHVSAPQLYLDGAVFNDSLFAVKNGAGTNYSAGANVFNGYTYISNQGSASIYMANASRDVFNGETILSSGGSGTLYIAYNDATLPTEFNRDVKIESYGSSGGLVFGSGTGSFTMALAAQMSIGSMGFTSGTLNIRRGYFSRPFAASVPGFLLSQCVFADSLQLTKNGTGSNTSYGANVFHSYFSLTNLSTANITMAGTVCDTFFSDASFVNNSSGILYLAQNDVTGTFFGGNVFISNTGSGSVRFGQGSGKAFLSAGKTVLPTGAGVTAGSVYLRNFVQNGNEHLQLLCSNTATIYFQTGSLFGGNVHVSSGAIYLNGSTFLCPSLFEKTGSSTITTNGGNVFRDSATFINASTGTWRLINSTADTCYGPVTFIRNGAGSLEVAYNQSLWCFDDIITGGSSQILFGASSGSLIIAGSGNRSFIGNVTSPPTIRRLEMKTPDRLILSIPVQISVSLVLDSGIIVSHSAAMPVLTDETVSVGIGNAQSYIDGPMQFTMSFNGARSLNFPLGKQMDWRPVSLSVTHSSSTAYIYTAELFNEDANALSCNPMPATVSHLSYQHYWQIDRSSAAGLVSAQATFYYDQNDVVTDPAFLTVVKSSGAACPSAWVDVGGTASGSGVGSIVSGAFTSFSTFTLGNVMGGTNPLPVTWTSAEADCSEGGIWIHWSTLSETGSSHFIVEELNTNGTFEQVAIIAASGNSNSLQEYSSFIPRNQDQNLVFRVREVDIDGSEHTSELISAQCHVLSQSCSVFPNPSTGFFEIGLSENDFAFIRISDSQGRILHELQATTQSIPVDASFLQPGCYHIEIATASGFFTSMPLMISR